MKKWFGILVVVGLLLTAVGCSTPKSAQPATATAGKLDYPTKPITMIIAFTAGGSSDVQARIVEKYWKEEFGQSLVFMYKTGAGGAIGFNEIAKAPKDGYTIGGVNLPHIVLQPMGQGAQFSVDDFDYLAQVVNDPQVFAVNKKSQFNSLKDFVSAAKKDPGKYTVGIVGTYTSTHMAILDLEDKAGIKVTLVNFKGSADQNAAVLGGQVDAMMGNLDDVMRDLDNYKVLGVATPKRHSLAPDVPTFAEQGYNVISDVRRGFVVPKGTDSAIVKRLRDGLYRITHRPDYLADMEKIGQPTEYMSGEDFDKYVHDYNSYAQDLLKKFNLLK